MNYPGEEDSGMPHTPSFAMNRRAFLGRYAGGLGALALAQLVADAGETPGFTSLEGYIDARVFIAGLLAHQGPFTPDSLITAFETLPNLSLGIGANAGFGPANHQYSSSVWGTSIQPTGSFKNLYFWTSGSAIQFFE